MNKIKADSGELNRIMKTMSRCIDKRFSIHANIQISHENDKLTIRATNGVFLGEMSMNVPGGTGETFCIDGDMFGKVISLCKGNVEILTDEKNCSVKGAGRTRMPIINTTIKGPDKIKGKSVTVKAEHFKKAYSLVGYAVATDQSRPALTGVYVETDNEMRFVSMDGFQMAIESIPFSGDEINIIIPAGFMDLICAAVSGDSDLKLITDGKRIQAQAENMIFQCALLAGPYVEYRRLLPNTYITETIVTTTQILDALKSGLAIAGKEPTSKVRIMDSEIIISQNSIHADFEAKIPCDMHGEGIQTAFNSRYLINTIGVIEADEVILKLNTKTSPVFIQGKDLNGIHMCMPVHLWEGTDKQDEDE